MREVKFRGFVENINTGVCQRVYYGVGSKPCLCGMIWIVKDEQFTGLYDSTKWAELTEDERSAWMRAGKSPSEWKGKEVYDGDKLSQVETVFIVK